MAAIDDQSERRRNSLLGAPNQRRTLLSTNNNGLGEMQSFTESNCVPVKRRKGLLSTPGIGPVQPRSALGQDTAGGLQMGSKESNRRSLLPNKMCINGGEPQPLLNGPISRLQQPVPSSNATVLVPSSGRRVLLPFSPKRKDDSSLAPTPISESPVRPVNGHEAKASAANRSSLLGSVTGIGPSTIDTKKTGRYDRSTMTEERTAITDLNEETDLNKLYQQRIAIDRRIAELRARGEREPQKDGVNYVNGYYCRPCRKFIGDYGAKVAHCVEPDHLLNLDDDALDPETILKYFEERYEGISFDDGEESPSWEDTGTSKPNLNVAQQASARFSGYVPPSSVSPRIRPSSSMPKLTDQEIKSTTTKGGSSMEDSLVERLDESEEEKEEEDEEDGSGDKTERFNKTIISRRTADNGLLNKEKGTQGETGNDSILRTFSSSSNKTFGPSIIMTSSASRHQTACAHRSLPRYYSNNYGKQNALGVVGNGIVYSSPSPYALVCDDSYLASGGGGGRKSDQGDSSLMEGYELSTDFQQKQMEVLERKYGGRIRARRAAVVIQRAFRKYRLEKKFQNLRLVASDGRNSGRSRMAMNRFHSATTANRLFVPGVPLVVSSSSGQRYSHFPQHQQQYHHHLQQYTKRTVSTSSDRRTAMTGERRDAASTDVISQEASPADGVYEMKRYGARVIMGNQQAADKTAPSKSKLKLHRYNVDDGRNHNCVIQLQHGEASPRGSVLHDSSSSIHVKVSGVASMGTGEERSSGITKYRPPAVNILRNRSLSVERAAVIGGGPGGSSLCVSSDNTAEKPRREEPRHWEGIEGNIVHHQHQLSMPYSSYIRLAPCVVMHQPSSGTRVLSSCRPCEQQYTAPKSSAIHHSTVSSTRSEGWNSYKPASSYSTTAAEGRPDSADDCTSNYSKYQPGSAAAALPCASPPVPVSTVYVPDSNTELAPPMARLQDNVTRQRRLDSDHTAPVWLPMTITVENGGRISLASDDPSRPVDNAPITASGSPCKQPVLSRSIPESQWLRHWGRRSLISAPHRQSELERKRQYRIALNFFNKKPERGVQFLVDFGFVDGTPGAVAKLLISRKGLSKQMIGEYLGNLLNPFNMAVLDCFANEVDMTGSELDVALRRFQALFRLPGEAQKIERIMEVFARRYCDCNPEVVKQFRQADTLFLLAFAIIMLNTDLHSPNIKPERRMKLEDFLKNLRGIDGGSDVDGKFLTGIYHRVKDQEFKPGTDHVTQVLKVDRSIVGKKPTLALPHRRLVCYCRLYEVTDEQKKQAANVHQREIFLFNDVVLITKILSRKKNAITYAFRSCHSLVGMQVQPFKNQYYPNGLRINHTLENKTLLFNARSEEDRVKFMEDLKESICESDEMEALRIELELEKQNKYCGNTNPSSANHRSHSLGRGEQRDSGLPELDDNAVVANSDSDSATKVAASTSGAQARASDADAAGRARNTKPRCASLSSLDSGMSSTASTVSRESSPKNVRPSSSERGPPSVSTPSSSLSQPRPLVDIRRLSGSLTPPPQVTYFTESSEV